MNGIETGYMQMYPGMDALGHVSPHVDALIQQRAVAGASTEQKSHRTLWMGDLAVWMDESFLYTLFAPTNQLISVKVIRNKGTGLSEGYAFLEMKTHDAAEHILQTCNGRPIPGAGDMLFRLNWAAYGVGRSSQPSDEGRHMQNNCI